MCLRGENAKYAAVPEELLGYSACVIEIAVVNVHKHRAFKKKTINQRKRGRQHFFLPREPNRVPGE